MGKDRYYDNTVVQFYYWNVHLNHLKTDRRPNLAMEQVLQTLFIVLLVIHLVHQQGDMGTTCSITTIDAT